MARNPRPTTNRSPRSATAPSEPSSPAAEPQPLDEIVFDFIKSPMFRTVAVDGVFGGASPNGRSLTMSVYSERRPIPKQVTHIRNTDYYLGDEIEDRRQIRQADFVRELDATLTFDLITAKSIRVWLDEKISELEFAQEHLKIKGRK